jgi:uncharacterized protein
MEPWIHTYIGKKFFPLDPKVSDIDILDIAHALSNKCRYAGHTINFYSVGEHSIHIHDYLLSKGYAKSIIGWGLLHDAAEAYLFDIPRPIKNQIAGFEQLENNLLSIVAKAFGLPEVMPKIVKEIDFLMLGVEKDQAMTSGPKWQENIENMNRLPIILKFWKPKKCEKEFIKRFNGLNI